MIDWCLWQQCRKHPTILQRCRQGGYHDVGQDCPYNYPVNFDKVFELVMNKDNPWYWNIAIRNLILVDTHRIRKMSEISARSGLESLSHSNQSLDCNTPTAASSVRCTIYLGSSVVLKVLCNQKICHDIRTLTRLQWQVFPHNKHGP